MTTKKNCPKCNYCFATTKFILDAMSADFHCPQCKEKLGVDVSWGKLLACIIFNPFIFLTGTVGIISMPAALKIALFTFLVVASFWLPIAVAINIHIRSN